MTDGKIFLSSEAAAELNNMPPKDRNRTTWVMDEMASSDKSPEVRVLKLRGKLSPYLMARAGRYRIIFRYLDPDERPVSPSGDEGSPSPDVMVASIIQAGAKPPSYLG